MDPNREQLIARIGGRDSDRALIAQLAQSADGDLVRRLRDELMDAHWPRCIGLANALARIGGEGARSALRDCLRAKRHHVRTASIGALVSIGDVEAVAVLELMLGDPAYETRMAAKQGIFRLSGEEVVTARGE